MPLQSTPTDYMCSHLHTLNGCKNTSMNSLFQLLREILRKDSVMLKFYVDATKALPHLGLESR